MNSRAKHPRARNSRAQASHSFVILFGLLLISMTVWVFSSLERRIVEEDFQCEPILEDVHSELLLAKAYSSKYTSYERTLTIPGNEILFAGNTIACGPHSRETNINLAGLGSFREGVYLIRYENGERVWPERV